jgi:serine phosphatase RsbU (regulator of sigma subunit)
MMKKTGRLFIIFGAIIFAVFLFKQIVEPDSQYFAFWLTAWCVVFLGISFLAFPLDIKLRKKFARNAFIISVTILALHLSFKFFHWPGASILAFSFFSTLIFIFLPIHTKNRIDKWREYTEKSWQAYWLSISDLLSLAAVFGGLLFRVFHWPLANVILVTGVFLLTATLISWNSVFSRQIVLRKKAEEKIKEAYFKLNEQKTVIEEKTTEILSSITYAKRLQQAILPSETTWKSHLPDSFVLYAPKDIVAGDFYWIEEINDLVLFAAADCTGHGVPGALVSVVCSNALNRTVKEFKITDPGSILDKVRELVIETFGKSEREVKDGMDISLCCLNLKSFELKWAGANNPLWLIQAGKDEVIEIKGDKQPIGKYAEEKQFTTHAMQLSAGDLLYLFTDGYADQFGGPMGKKFKYKQMKDLIARISNSGMDEQKDKIAVVFSDWRANLEQVDDICIIGVRV